MTSKERVMTALHRREPDRVPLNYSANSGIDLRLKQYFHLGPDDSEGLLQALGVDFRRIAAPYRGARLHADIPQNGVRVDEWGIHRRWVEHDTGGYWDVCDFPLRDADTQTITNWPMPSADDFDYSRVHEQCRQMKDYCVVAGGAGIPDVINKTGMVRTMEQVLIDLALEYAPIEAYIDKRLGILREVMKRTLEAANGGIDLLWTGEDLGTQIGPLVSKDFFRTHLQSRLQMFVDLADDFHVPVIIHSCGSSSWAFDDFIDMGIAAVDTLQPEAQKMSPRYLKQTYGGRLAFHGCISTAGPIATGTVRETIDYCSSTLAIMMPGGGYCFAPTHAIQDNSPTENIVAMYDCARTHGRY